MKPNEQTPIKDAIHLTCAAFLSTLLVIATIPCLPFVWLWNVIVNNEE